jgi:hypothetical protein
MQTLSVKHLACALTCLLSASVFAQTLPAASAPAGCSSIDPRPNVLLVSGTLDGRPVRVFVDTGGSGGISRSLAKQLAPIPGKKARFAGASGRWRETDLYEVAGLRIGDAEIPRFTATTLMPLPTSSTAGPFDVMVGVPELKDFVVEIDLQANRFCPRPRVPYPSLTMRPFELKKHKILVPAKLGQRSFESFIFDTGAGVTTLAEKWLVMVPHRRRQDTVVSVDGSGVRRKQYYVDVSEICLFDQCRARQVVMPDQDLSALNGFPVDGILGMTFLKGCRIVLDMPRRQLAITVAPTA